MVAPELGIRRLQALGTRLAARFAPPPIRRTGFAQLSFRNWPSWLFFAPVALRALARGVQHGDLSLAAIANPLPGRDLDAISASKSAVFASLGPEARGWVPPYVVIRNAPGEPVATVAEALAAMRRAGLRFPVVAKPDRGTGGKGVRRLSRESELLAYAAAFPPGQRFLLQELVDLPNEAGIMYVRYPGSLPGRVVGLAFKLPATATGDGSSTLRALIAAHPHVRHLRRQAASELGTRLEEVPAPGERVELVFARNRSGGAVCLDACDHITPALTRAVDRIAEAIPGFHIGRFDVRFDTPERLRAGEGFRVLEINCGISEPLHAWHPGNGAFAVWRAYFRQIDLVYRIGAANRARGHAAPGTLSFLRTLSRQTKLVASFAKKG